MIGYISRLFINLIFVILVGLDKLIKKIFKRNGFLQSIHDKLENKQYYFIKINNKNTKFFCPSTTTLIRVLTFYDKEPETLNWIKNFNVNNDKKIIFWDIGANIGLYSLYAAIMFNNIEVASFEPSTSNTRTLSRNISINKLSNKIKILPFALSEKLNAVSSFKETFWVEGGATATFDHDFDYTGKKISNERIQNEYQIFGTKIDYLIQENILQVPNYLKIDVDGLEHLILEGSKKLLQNNELKEILIEMNPGFNHQYHKIEEILKQNGFQLSLRTNSRLNKNSNYKLKTNETVNAIFKR